MTISLNIYLQVLVLFLLLNGNEAFGQKTAQSSAASNENVLREISEASKVAKVELSDAILKDFLTISRAQSGDVEEVYKAVPKDIRVMRLAEYLNAKTTLVNSGDATKMDLADFHWGYLKQDLKYTPAHVEAYRGAKFTAIELKGKYYSFNASTTNQNKTILLPTYKGEEFSNVTAVFDSGSKKSLWTGRPGTADIKVMQASTTKGCEIIINSTPQKATVFFNRREWYERTNTSAVRDPGPLEIVVKLAGYKEWRSQRTLAPGETWTVEALLSKE